MNTPEPFNDLSWNDDPLHSPNRTEYIEKLRARVKELESIANEVSKEYPLQKYVEERLGTKGEHSHFETIDNTTAKLTALEKEVARLSEYLERHQEEIARLTKERDQLKGEVEIARDALWKINTYPVHSEPLGGAMDMQDIASNALSAINKPNPTP